MLKKQEKSKHSDYYQRNKEKRKTERREYYANQKKQEQLTNQKLYQASSIKVLLSLKEYTELNPAKKKLWLDFCWTIQDCQENGFYDIIQIQKLEQVAGNLARDYYQVAQGKSQSSWNSLSEEQKSKLIKYWGQEKVRKEQELAQGLVQQEEKGVIYEKTLAMAKFHEERGKIKCECWQCAEQKEIQKEVKEQIKKEFKVAEPKEKEQCPECERWVKELDEENGICQKCLEEYEG